MAASSLEHDTNYRTPPAVHHTSASVRCFRPTTAVRWSRLWPPNSQLSLVVPGAPETRDPRTVPLPSSPPPASGAGSHVSVGRTLHKNEPPHRLGRPAKT